MAADVPYNVLQIGSKFCVPEERVGDVVKGKNVAPFDFIISAVGKVSIGAHNGLYCVDRRDKARLSLRCPSYVSAAKQVAKKSRQDVVANVPYAEVHECTFRVDASQKDEDIFATICKCNLHHTCSADPAHAVERQRKIRVTTHMKGGDSMVLECLQPAAGSNAYKVI